MLDQLNRYINPIKTRWTALTRSQQYKLVGVILVVIIAIALAAFFIFRTRWVILVPNTGAMEALPMQQALNAENIPNRLSRDMSTVYVDERRFQDAVIALTVQNATPSGDHFTWPDAFDTGLGTTESERFHRSRLATAGQIEMRLLSMEGITQAGVILNLSNPRPFDRNAPPPSASITITTSRDIQPHEARGLASIATNAVNGLTLDNVTIIDQHMRTIWDGEINNNNDPVSTVQETRNQHRNHVENAVMRMLSSMYDEVHPTVNFVFEDTIFTEQIANVFSAVDGFDGGIPSTSQTSRAQMEGLGGGLEPGIAWNAGAAPAYQMGGAGNVSAEQRESFIDYHVNHHQTISQIGPGWVDTANSTAAFSVTRWTYIYQDHWMAQNEGATEMDWEIFVNESRLPTNITSEYNGFDDTFSLLLAATGLPEENVQLVVMEQIITTSSFNEPWNIPLFFMLAVLVLLLLMLAYGLLQRQKQENEEEESEPELSVEDLLVSTQLEEAKEEAQEELDAIEYFKENEVKRHIEKFVNEKPEAVAALLRNWINVEEW
ncbi:MAG: hypothetical protein FWE05_08590 [Defluviitaleaceae bacterium]|nr:hypothetical protein [Defluviitaleaceae bacterium]